MYTKKNITRKITEHNKKSTKNHLNYAEMFKAYFKDLSFHCCEVIRIFAEQQQKTGKVYFSQSTIARVLNICRATANRVIAELAKKFIINKVYRPNKTCLYRVVFVSLLSSSLVHSLRLYSADVDALFRSHVTRYIKQNAFLLKKLVKRGLIFFDGTRPTISATQLCTKLAIKLADGDLHQALIFSIFTESLLREAYYIYRRNKKWVRNKHGYIYTCCLDLCKQRGITPQWRYYYDNKEHLDLFELEKKQKQQSSNNSKVAVFADKTVTTSVIVEKKVITPVVGTFKQLSLFDQSALRNNRVSEEIPYEKRIALKAREYDYLMPESVKADLIAKGKVDLLPAFGVE